MWICLQFSVLVKACVKVDENVHQEDENYWEVDY